MADDVDVASQIVKNKATKFGIQVDATHTLKEGFHPWTFKDREAMAHCPLWDRSSLGMPSPSVF